MSDWLFWGFVLLLVGFGLGVGGGVFFFGGGGGFFWLVGFTFFTITMTSESLGGRGVDVMVKAVEPDK